MSSWTELLDRAAPGEHVVQLYGRNDQLLTRNATRYLAHGLRRGDALLVIARSEHADAILRQLAAECIETAEALRQRRLISLDARETLDRLMVDDEPDRARFQSIVGGALQSVQQRSLTGGLRVFGEMVGLLWEAGRRAAATRLEEYWNEFLAGSACSLFCAYPIDIFDAPSRSGLDAVLRAHTHMSTGPGTMLSSSRPEC